MRRELAGLRPHQPLLRRRPGGRFLHQHQRRRPQQPLQHDPDRRRGQQRPLRPLQHRHAGRHDRRPADLARRHPGAAARPVALRHPPGRVHRRRHQRRHPRRRERFPRLRLRLTARPQLRRRRAVQQPDRGLQRGPVRPPPRRSARPRPLLLFRQRREQPPRGAHRHVGRRLHRHPVQRSRRRRRAEEPCSPRPTATTPAPSATSRARPTATSPSCASTATSTDKTQVTLAPQLRQRQQGHHRQPVEVGLPLRQRPIRQRQRHQLDGLPAQQRLRLVGVQRGAARLPDHPRQARRAGDLPVDRDRRHRPAQRRAARRHRALLGRQRPRPGHPRADRRLHLHQGHAHHHRRHPQRGVQVHEPLPLRLLRLLLLPHHRRLAGRRRHPVLDQLRQRRRPAPRDLLRNPPVRPLRRRPVAGERPLHAAARPAPRQARLRRLAVVQLGRPGRPRRQHLEPPPATRSSSRRASASTGTPAATAGSSSAAASASSPAAPPTSGSRTATPTPASKAPPSPSTAPSRSTPIRSTSRTTSARRGPPRST